ncbi:hypothetical protein L1049_017930 [Liquidambar formosana]|uniref:C3H1-type domain-containing protein n=1 Tax=Liquidambar formosana TaxID=63359 RepID=A0AAP0NHM3_LIQFO
MAMKAARRVVDGSDRAVYNCLGGGGSSNRNVCSFWLAGRCNRNPCRFMHGESPPHTYNRIMKQSCVSTDDLVKRNSNLSSKNLSVSSSGGGGSGGKITQKNQESRGDGSRGKVTQKNQESREGGSGGKISQTNQERVCQYWVLDNCVQGDRCQYLHSWFSGDGFSRLAQLEGHKKAVTGIALPSGSDKLYSGSSDGTVHVWDCNTGQCAGVVNLGGEIGSLISEGPWLFVGMPNVIKAWNIQTCADHSLSGPVGQVYAMVVGKEILFAGAQDGAILAWKPNSETNSFQLAVSMKGHSGAVVSLVVGANRLYSGSMDHTIRVWDIDTLQCIHTLTGHTAVVMSLLCWDQYLLSCSLDQTIKVWVATEGGNVEVAYTHNEEHGVLALCGMHDAEAKPILFCSSNDNSVHLYELPSFAERGKLFSRQEVRSIQIGPGGLFFTGDGSGRVTVWKWQEPSAGAS